MGEDCGGCARYACFMAKVGNDFVICHRPKICQKLSQPKSSFQNFSIVEWGGLLAPPYGLCSIKIMFIKHFALRVSITSQRFANNYDKCFNALIDCC